MEINTRPGKRFGYNGRYFHRSCAGRGGFQGNADFLIKLKVVDYMLALVGRPFRVKIAQVLDGLRPGIKITRSPALVVPFDFRTKFGRVCINQRMSPAWQERSIYG